MKKKILITVLAIPVIVIITLLLGCYANSYIKLRQMESSINSQKEMYSLPDITEEDMKILDDLLESYFEQKP